MNQQTAQVTTKELWAKLFQTPTVGGFLSENEASCAVPAFSDYISGLCKVKGIKPEQVLKKAGIEKSFGHRLFSGTRNPSRDTVLMLAFGFGLTTDETQQLLKTARAAMLYPKIPRDAVIAFCLYHGKSLVDTQLILAENSLPELGGRRNQEGY